MNSVHVITVRSLERESIPVIELTMYHSIYNQYIPTDSTHFIESENAKGLEWTLKTIQSQLLFN